ncbi:GNAT family N-acetyltransferase [Halorussus limi]|uniref:GNAT family N-acetyltransferase n=1 Tax=Halorussus limi TaxID=2938695 RepID=A0A8U0HYA6_9EURY|nr:GNAT family N-acetyltransferase [Halorussus limi]UPV75524.1 GNAT family N-acetyltransferase [Halorussus limi]
MSGDRGADGPDRVAVREATADDRLGVRRVLDAAMLDVRDDLEARIDAGDVLVANERDRENGPIIGALVLVPHGDGGPDATDEAAPTVTGDAAHIDAVAVRRARRGQGVGAALVRAAAERRAPLTAAFDPGVRPFYDSLGFEISRSESDADRLRGRYDADGA